MSIKSIAACALAGTVLATTMAEARSFLPIVNEPEKAISLDLDSVSQVRGMKRGWFYAAYLTPQAGGKFYVALDEYNCAEGKSRNLALITYDEAFNIVTHDNEADSWTFIIPDSPGAMMKDAVCLERSMWPESSIQHFDNFKALLNFNAAFMDQFAAKYPD